MSIAITYPAALIETDELQELIHRCVAHERTAQNRMYHVFYPKMMALVRRYFPEDVYAEEILNNGFLKAFQKMHTYQFKGSFEGWLRKIVFHSVSDYVKNHVKYKKQIQLDDKEYYLGREDSDNLEYQDLMTLIGELPDTSRVVFNMFVMEGMPHKAIGKELGISEGTSKWHLCEARKILKEKIIKLNLNT